MGGSNPSFERENAVHHAWLALTLVIADRVRLHALSEFAASRPKKREKQVQEAVKAAMREADDDQELKTLADIEARNALYPQVTDSMIWLVGSHDGEFVYPPHWLSDSEHTWAAVAIARHYGEACPVCNGEGELEETYGADEHIKFRTVKCGACHGLGQFVADDDDRD